MQKAQLLSQPIWIVTHAAWATLAADRQHRREHLVRVGCLPDLGDGPSARPPRAGGRRRGGRCGCRRRRRRAAPARAIELAVLLGQAAADAICRSGPRGLQRLEVAEVAVELVVGVLPDAARVQDDDVGVVDASAGTRPSASSSPAIRSESCSFIWHPKVRTRYVRATTVQPATTDLQLQQSPHSQNNSKANSTTTTSWTLTNRYPPLTLITISKGKCTNRCHHNIQRQSQRP